MEKLLAAILADDRSKVRELLKADKGLATTPIEEARFYDSQIFHWLYVGDVALHLAAAGYRVELVKQLLDAGADPNAAANRRQSTPFHYAADGYINGPAWDAKRQVKTLNCLLDAGAHIDARDKNGATPLHRAVRTRCAAAVKFLLDAGSNATLKNKPGSTPFHLAVQNTGRGGSGSEEAKGAQREIVEQFLAHGVSTALKDGKGNSVVQCARRSWIEEVLIENAV
ncbi:MAG TPA: ankyrin repeat domain-containing protein [Pyrinomonadaceae bacterium]|nr:ankyrin repeat domain-containing protein [Pyrinomonadaceae bacterium]